MSKQYLSYIEDPHFAIKEMAVVGTFNGWNKEANPLEKNTEGVWACEIDVEPGEYLYKFLINGGIYMNDPLANLYDMNEEEKLMSCLVINEQGERLFNTVAYEINIKKIGFEKKDLHFYMEFARVSGIHTVTAIWCHNDSKSYVWGEEILVPTEEGDEQVGFSIDKEQEGLGMGAWKIDIFIDGKFVYEHHFALFDERLSEQVDRLYPIGTLVRIKGGSRRVMVIGRMQTASNGGDIYDYSGCMYPQGMILSNRNILFNHEQVEEVVQMGLVDEEEEVFKEELKTLLKG